MFSGQIVDVHAGEIYGGSFSVVEGRIVDLRRDIAAPLSPFYLPGFVDSHVHIESSLLSPVEFARAAVVHGTVATVSDPHEIANVCGLAGVKWMLDNASQTPFKIFFGAPSCVPATPFERSGAVFGPAEIAALLADPRILYLSEVMNFPAVLAKDPAMMANISCAMHAGKRIDGHAPGLVGRDLLDYAAAGIETDHECTTLDEARQRATCGMKVAIREGSAARNFEALWPLLLEFPEMCFFCSDDKHPDDLIMGHIQTLVARAVQNGVPLMSAIRAATLNPVQHYGLPVGLLRNGDPADFIEVTDLSSFKVNRTFIGGQCLAEHGKTRLPAVAVSPINNFSTSELKYTDLQVPVPGRPVPIIVALDGQLVTGREDVMLTVRDSLAVADEARDLLKIVVYNRYENQPPAVAFIRNFGLKAAAMASSVAHDSHNIVAVGSDDHLLTIAINEVVKARGGLSFASSDHIQCFPLPIAGLMGTSDAWSAAEAFSQLTHLARSSGCSLRSPYMTLSFMALLVIPSLKIGDRGLFDVDRFCFVDTPNR